MWSGPAEQLVSGPRKPKARLIPTTAVPIQKTQVHEFFSFEQIVRCLTMYKERNIGAPCGYRNRNGNSVPFPDRDST